jgi:hypothetical protein
MAADPLTFTDTRRQCHGPARSEPRRVDLAVRPYRTPLGGPLRTGSAPSRPARGPSPPRCQGAVSRFVCRPALGARSGPAAHRCRQGRPQRLGARRPASTPSGRASASRCRCRGETGPARMRASGSRRPYKPRFYPRWVETRQATFSPFLAPLRAFLTVPARPLVGATGRASACGDGFSSR